MDCNHLRGSGVPSFLVHQDALIKSGEEAVALQPVLPQLPGQLASAAHLIAEAAVHDSRPINLSLSLNSLLYVQALLSAVIGHELRSLSHGFAANVCLDANHRWELIRFTDNENRKQVLMPWDAL